MTAEDIISGLTASGLTVATAESLTGGLVCAALTDVPGASACVLGGVVAYDVAVKAALLGVDQGLLERQGAVDPEVARQMAAGARRVLGASIGVATTGSAGPDAAPGGSESARQGPLGRPAGPHGVPPGRGFVAVSGPNGDAVRGFDVQGSRSEVRAHAVAAALDLLREAL